MFTLPERHARRPRHCTAERQLKPKSSRTSPDPGANLAAAQPTRQLKWTGERGGTPQHSGSLTIILGVRAFRRKVDGRRRRQGPGSVAFRLVLPGFGAAPQHRGPRTGRSPARPPGKDRLAQLQQRTPPNPEVAPCQTEVLARTLASRCRGRVLLQAPPLPGGNVDGLVLQGRTPGAGALLGWFSGGARGAGGTGCPPCTSGPRLALPGTSSRCPLDLSTRRRIRALTSRARTRVRVLESRVCRDF